MPGRWVNVDCPRCGRSLWPEKEGLHRDISIQKCEGCGGLWMHREALDRLDDNIFLDVTRLPWVRFDRLEDDRAELGCPACPRSGAYRTARGVTLERLAPAHVDEPIIFRCPRCNGFFLDAGALEAVRARAAVER